MGKDFNLLELEKEIVMNEIDPADLHEGDMKIELDYMRRQKNDDEFFETLMESMEGEPDADFKDPIMLTLMTDPVVVSSGMIFDRTTCVDNSGNIKLPRKKCPYTN